MDKEIKCIECEHFNSVTSKIHQGRVTEYTIGALECQHEYCFEDVTIKDPVYGTRVIPGKRVKNFNDYTLNMNNVCHLFSKKIDKDEPDTTVEAPENMLVTEGYITPQDTSPRLNIFKLLINKMKGVS